MVCVQFKSSMRFLFPLTTVSVTVLICFTIGHIWVLEKEHIQTHSSNIRIVNLKETQKLTCLNVSDEPQRTEDSGNSLGHIRSRVGQDNSTEVRHIGFLKVHKCGSSTFLNILYRFGYKRNLDFVTPIKGNYLQLDYHRSEIAIVPPPINNHFDILCNHVPRFSKREFSHFLPSDAVYLAIIREPFQRMQSAFNYYKNVLKFGFLRGMDSFERYLKGVDKNEKLWGERSVTNNKMARDFGFPFHFINDVKRFRDHLRSLDKTFNLVLVNELFDESMILVKRLLNWHLQDVIYIVQNSNKYATVSANVSESIQPYLALDYILYNHFYDKLKSLIASQKDDFQEELSYFRKINLKTTNFCNSGKGDKILFEENNWHGEFAVTKQHCELMVKSELNFLSVVRDRQIAKVQKHGANLTHFFHKRHFDSNDLAMLNSGVSLSDMD